MALDPKSVSPRATQSPTKSKTTDAEKAAKLYANSTQSKGASKDYLSRAARPMLGDQSSDVRIKSGSIRVADGKIFAQVTMPISPPIVYRRIKLERDRNRPLEFEGRVLAEVTESSHDGAVILRAAIYQTKGGKYVDELTRFEAEPGVDYGETKPPYLFAKAEVFDSQDIAAMWFRTKGGRLTQRLMQQLGDVESEFIE
jgi:hypothetical protein